MLKVLWNTICVSTALVGASLMATQGTALANEANSEVNADANRLENRLENRLDAIASIDLFDRPIAGTEQVTSVSQLRDVSPGDWAFQALQSLVERYGCIAGYPSGRYLGNRSLTRYEFAAGLNACLDRVNELIAASTSSLATQEDLTILQRLQEEFAAELATLRGRVDALEARTTELESNQFSTTTKLHGQSIFVIAGANDPHFDGRDSDEDQVIFSHRTRLDFNTSFTGKDLLFIELEASNIPNLLGDRTQQTELSFASNTENSFNLGEMFYRFPVADNLTAWVGVIGVGVNEFVDVMNPYLASDGNGTVSRFGRRDPLVFRGPEGTGVGVRYEGDRLSASLGYLAGDAADAAEGKGLFNGSYSATAAVNYQITDVWKVGLAYSYRYYTPDSDLSGGTGSSFGRRPFGADAASHAHNIGLQTTAIISEQLAIGGWVSASFADEIDGDDDATLVNWAVSFAFPDLFQEGNLGAILVGRPPYVAAGGGIDEEDDPTLHIEALYRIAINDYIHITPAAIFLTHPENDNDNDNDAAVVGLIRTTFEF